MPYASDKQRGLMHALHPRIAARWDAEEKRAPVSVIDLQPELAGLAEAGLVGISDRALRDHVELYQRARTRLAAVRAARARPAPRPLEIPGLLSAPEARALLSTRVCDLALGDFADQLDGAVTELDAELTMKGVAWRPHLYLGDGDFWAADRAISVNIPWYLANRDLWALVNDRLLRYTQEDVLKLLRHEVGHALGYAFELWRRPEWQQAFGDFDLPYEDNFPIDPTSTDFVEYLSTLGAGACAHYAQKHPDEDWAETFACWLDPSSRWREAYAECPGALAKLEAVELMIVGRGAAYGPPAVTSPGRRIPYTSLTYTVGEFIGDEPSGEIDEAEAARRAEAPLVAVVELHRLYFEQLARGAGAATPVGRFGTAVDATWGSVESWLRDLRECARDAGGWALAVWDARAGAVRNVLIAEGDVGAPPGAPVLVAIDCHEHAWVEDYGLRKDLGIAATFRNLDWRVVDVRFDEACPPPLPLLERTEGPFGLGPLPDAVLVDPVPAPPPLAAPDPGPHLSPTFMREPGQEDL